MKPEDFDIHKLIERLQGTSDPIESHLPEGMDWEDLTEQDHAEIDNHIFKCESCGWWCENSEMILEQECQDCDEGKDQDNEEE